MTLPTGATFKIEEVAVLTIQEDLWTLVVASQPEVANASKTRKSISPLLSNL